MKLILLAIAFISASAFAWPSSNLSCVGLQGTFGGHPLYMKLDFQMVSSTSATGLMSDGGTASGPWTQGCTTPNALSITPVNGLFEISGVYSCTDGSGGQAVMMFDPNAMSIRAGQGSSATTYTCQWQ